MAEQRILIMKEFHFPHILVEIKLVEVVEFEVLHRKGLRDHAYSDLNLVNLVPGHLTANNPVNLIFKTEVGCLACQFVNTIRTSLHEVKVVRVLWNAVLAAHLLTALSYYWLVIFMVS